MAFALFALLAIAHLGLLGIWLGSMLYSLLIVQPRASRFLAADDDGLEAFLTTLGAGNRRPVLAIVAVLGISGLLLAVAGKLATSSIMLFALEGLALLAALAVFVRVSWRLWPRRVFALPEERPAHRRVLHRHAVTMIALVGVTFTLAVLAILTATPTSR
ncbi:hypothetical protein EF847_20385 [Actinobacteria bacterium YIM 96077]|uniref:Copper resistance protein D domain-containing protein n=1 Tax=Phytoactinopolyspora halophila TaxID=1981511 RepID=A0A329QJN1_9ACTN|nr:hypothetical protein [Phytoactinopolyspora halophila]AYY14697.1 hypothetical protein EF847_20385 [Actinobacteria bacterium YIM 96077]RAW11592.1 hypothetical protein DPM12_16065 [Phytoactinopolyspora halophila]